MIWVPPLGFDPYKGGKLLSLKKFTQSINSKKKIFQGNPTLHRPTLHEDNSTQKLDTERLYTRAALHQITLHEKQ